MLDWLKTAERWTLFVILENCVSATKLVYTIKYIKTTKIYKASNHILFSEYFNLRSTNIEMKQASLLITTWGYTCIHSCLDLCIPVF